MNKVNIRYNTNTTSDEDLHWRVLIDGVEHLAINPDKIKQIIEKTDKTLKVNSLYGIPKNYVNRPARFFDHRNSNLYARVHVHPQRNDLILPIV